MIDISREPLGVGLFTGESVGCSGEICERLV